MIPEARSDIVRPTLEADLDLQVTRAQSDADEFLVVGTAGLWNVFTPQQAVDYVNQYIRLSASSLDQQLAREQAAR